MRVDGVTGQPAGAENKNSVLEAFRLGTEPAGYGVPAFLPTDPSLSATPIKPAALASIPTQSAPGTGTGGLY